MTRKQERHSVKVTCAFCGGVYYTSSPERPYICMSCRRAEGRIAASGSTSLTIAPHQALSFGTCQSCHMHDQELANGKCVMCRFYAMTDIDPDLSERARRSQGGEFDWVRKQR